MAKKANVKIVASFASLRGHDVGKPEMQRELDEGSTVGQLFTGLAEEFGSPFKKEIYNPDTNTLNDVVMVFVNGHLLITLNGLDTTLHNGDIIGLAPLLQGG